MNRGRIFVTADGTAATFWSDTDVRDSLNPSDRIFYPSGVMALRDGTRYRVQDGKVTLMQDRNGNRFTFDHDATKRVTQIRDSMKRTVTVSYTTNLDTLTFKGYGGAAQTLQVHYQALGNLLHPTGSTLQTYKQLFPQLDGTEVQFNPSLVSRVVLPSGREYRFRYNTYGELARVELPTGGMIDYLYDGGVLSGPGVITAGSVPEEKAVYRRLTERHEYPASNGAGGVRALRTVYNRPANTSPTVVTVDHFDSAGARISRDRHTFEGRAWSTFWKTPNSYPAWRESKETIGEQLDTNGTTLMRKTEMTWQQGRTVAWWGGGSASSPPADPRMTERLRRVVDNGYNLVAKTTYAYDAFNNVTDVREHDYGTSGTPTTHPRRRTQTTYVTTNTVDSVARNYTENTSAAPIHIRDLVAERWVYNVNPSTGTQTLVSRVRYNYDRYDGTSGHAALVARSTIAQHSSRETEQAYLPRHATTYKTRGNATSTERWLNTTSSWVTSYTQYDIAGNAVKTIDPRSHATSYDFADNFGAPNGEARTNSPPADLGSDHAFAFVRRVTNPVGHESWTQYDYSLGRAVDEEDANTRVRRTSYDVLGRVRQRDFPDGGQVRLYYSDIDATASHGGGPVFPSSQTALPLKRRAYTRIDTGLDRSDLTVFDGFGRALMTGVSSNAAANLDWTRTEYHGRCGLLRTSNPRSLTSSPANPAASNFSRWTTYTYDALCRVKRETSQDGQTIELVYKGNETTVTDQLLNPRRSVRDALGRVSSVVEPNEATGSLTVNSYTTTYAYDALDNLTGVVQGAQSRSFVYDTLGRLTQETHPEWGPATSASGSASYLYDAASNLTRKTDARGVQTNYNNYDALNRPSGKTYSDGTPAVGFTYDSASSSNGKGRLTGMTDGAGSESYQYDAMGRVSSIVRTTAPRPAVTANYTYNHLGGIKKAAYPGIYDYGGTPLAIYRSYDNRGRQTSAWWSNHSSGGQGGTAYQQMATGYGFVYNATSAQETTNFGNGTTETVTYSDRLQPTSRTVPGVLNLAASFSGPSGRNNGNVFQVADSYDATGNFTYTYDYLNRLATSTGPGSVLLQMTYDRWGNKSQAATGAGPHKPLSFLTGSYYKNRISSSGYTYDNAGNLTAEPADAWTGRGAMTYQYDAESRIKSTGGAATATYAYDGHGRRVKKTAGGQTRYYYYDPLGNPVWEYTTLWETYNLYFNGKLVFTNTAAMSPSTVWLHTDHQGSVRVKSNASGQAIAGTRLHYHPFGERVNAKTDPVQYEFTGKERDDDTRLDYFGARYYANTLGRFPHADVPGIDQSAGDPQSWSLFGYVRNNPLRFVDPTGRACRQRSNGTTYDDDSGGQSCAEVYQEDYERVSGALSGRVPADVEVAAEAWANDEARMRFVFGSVERLAGPTVRGLAGVTIGFVGAATGVGIASPLLGSHALSSLGLATAGVMNQPRVMALLSELQSGRSPRVKVVRSADELYQLFARLAAGGKPVQTRTPYEGTWMKLPDGTMIGLRHGNTIDIRLANQAIRKVHIQP
jgi:RHS repeat-associated protein